MNIRYALTGIFLTAVLAGGIFWVKKNNPVAQVSAGPVSGKAKGPANAKVQIAEYSDFQCPACAKSQERLNALLKTYDGQVSLVFHHFPLTMHRWSAVAHQAAECANRLGKFWDYQDRLFAEQMAWSNSNDPTPYLVLYAKDLNLDLDRFASCLSDKEVYEQVLEDRHRGDSLQINSTPTFFINGERVLGPAELDLNGEAIIRKVLGLPALPKPPAASPVPAAPQKLPVPAALPSAVPGYTAPSQPAQAASSASGAAQQPAAAQPS